MSALFDSLKESVTIKRYNPVTGNQDVVGDTETTPAEIYIELYQGRRADIQSTGQVFEHGDFVGILMSPIAEIEEGDIIIRADGESPQRLNVTSEQTVLGVQQITMEEPGK